MATHEVHAYAESVVSGDQVAGRLVRLACERHLRDLETGHERGLTFDEKTATRAVQFFPAFLTHWKGKYAGQAFTLEPWQQFFIGSLFGWKRDDGCRRFERAYVEVARKNGKSTTIAGVGLEALILDQEPGAEVYTAATKLDQARIIHKDAVQMVKRSGALSKYCKVFKNSITFDRLAGSYMPLGSDSDTLDGLNPHCVLIDELHAHKTRGLWEVLETALGARQQPILCAITTAGTDRTSLCWEQREYARKVLEQIVDDDAVLGLVYTLDDEDAWDDPDVWVKSNPNLGVSVRLDEIERRCTEAKASPARQNAFRRLRLNQWTTANTRFLDLGTWDQCAGELMPAELERAHEGDHCFVGLDLSSNRDLTAMVMVFPGEPLDVLARFWLPEQDIEDRQRKTGVPYLDWVRDGWLQLTPGNVVDHRYIVQSILEERERFPVMQLAFDRWGAASVVAELGDEGVEVVQFGQGYASMNGPTKEIERDVLAKKLRHGANPLLRWCADNLEVSTDPSGNIKPVKPDHKQSEKKIDGMVALIMARGLMMTNDWEAPAKSVYDQRGALWM